MSRAIALLCCKAPFLHVIAITRNWWFPSNDPSISTFSLAKIKTKNKETGQVLFLQCLCFIEVTSTAHQSILVSSVRLIHEFQRYLSLVPPIAGSPLQGGLHTPSYWTSAWYGSTSGGMKRWSGWWILKHSDSLKMDHAPRYWSWCLISCRSVSFIGTHKSHHSWGEKLIFAGNCKRTGCALVMLYIMFREPLLGCVPQVNTCALCICKSD